MKSITIALIIGTSLIAGALFLSDSAPPTPRETEQVNNVFMEGEVQVVAIDAKGGYLPRKSIAKAGVPTIIRFNTAATFDCSAAVRIPSLDISRTLPQTGSTDINVGTQKAGPLQGSCGMGMYPFEVEFVEGL